MCAAQVSFEFPQRHESVLATHESIGGSGPVHLHCGRVPDSTQPVSTVNARSIVTLSKAQ